GLFFVAPLAGYAVARVCGYGRNMLVGRRWLVGLALCVLAFTLGLREAQSLYTGWPDSTSLIHVLRTQVRPGDYHYLAEESEVPRYYLHDLLPWWQWTTLYWFQYTDAAGRHL